MKRPFFKFFMKQSRSINRVIMLPEDSFQKQNWKIFLISSLSGFYWPGVEQTLSIKLQWVFYSYSLFIAALPTVQLIAATISVAVNAFPLAVLISILRKCLALFPLIAKLMAHSIPSRRRQLEHLFEEWNCKINTGADKLERQELLKQQLIKPKRLFCFSVIVGVVLLQLPTIAMLFNRHVRGASMTYVPHDPEAWYHFYFVVLQLLAYFISHLASLNFAFLIIVLLAMGVTQLQLLKKNLKIICQNENGREEGDKLFAQRLVNDWIKDHQQTLRWLTDLKAFLRYTSTIKYIFIGSYICLVVFTMPKNIKTGSNIDIALIICYTVSTFALNFYECRLADKLHEESRSLFDDAYDGFWFTYPRSVSKSLSIIQTQTICRPIQLKAFRIAPDNSATFLSIMGAAYKALSFLLQLDIL